MTYWDDRYGHEAALYRYYDDGGALLYVGIAGHAEKRLMQHSLRAPWFPNAWRVTAEYYPDYPAARVAEAGAIAAEWPLWNQTGPWCRIAGDLASQVPGYVLTRRRKDGELTRAARRELGERLRVRSRLRRQLACQWCRDHLHRSLIPAAPTDKAGA